MDNDKNSKDKEIIVLRQGEGRTYTCGTMTAVFKTDEEETAEKYSVSEWWLEPNSNGPGAHQHEENDEGVLCFGRDDFIPDRRQLDKCQQRNVLENTIQDNSRLCK